MATGTGFRLSQHILIALAAVFVAVPVASEAQTRRDDNSPVREALSRGDVLPLSRIIQNARQTPPYSNMRFIGVADLDPIRMRYKLKFMDGDRVVFVYVDARSGRVLGHTR